MFRKEETWLHFVGIGGIGMSGIAEVFLNQGYLISGSDLLESDSTKRLSQLGAQVSIGHRKENIKKASVVVVSSAVTATNPEVLEAKRRHIPVIPRAEMLGELMRGKLGVAVAGSHGKTTTTSMLATVLTVAGLDPTIVIGGKVDSLGGNAKLGQGQFVVAEADESDGSFIHLPATFGIVTNIDNDHMDHFGSLNAIEDAFVGLVSKLPFYGLAIVCGEDAGVRRCLDRWTKPYQTYGLTQEWDLYAQDIRSEGLNSFFKVYSRDGAVSTLLGEIRLNIPGKHNVLNALACVLLGLRLDIPFQVISKGLAEFKGVKRRFEIRWQDIAKRQAIIDDYGHHPTEIRATLEAAKAFWPGRIISVFQPHRYSRTLHCHDEFLSAFLQSDVVLITDIYSAGEEPIPGISAESLVREIKKVAQPHQQVIYSGDLGATCDVLKQMFSENDLILCLGAGSITRLPDQIMAHLKS
ncbi:MAG: UDP-N-acetylmuramate--L-alanine ligase [Bdellovibrionia bacterium]